MSKIIKDLKLSVHSYKFWLAVFSLLGLIGEFVAQVFFHISITQSVNGLVGGGINAGMLLLIALGVIDNQGEAQKPVDADSMRDLWKNISDELADLKEAIPQQEEEPKKKIEEPQVITPTITYLPHNK